jgi:hypothetical protein
VLRHVSIPRNVTNVRSWGHEDTGKGSVEQSVSNRMREYGRGECVNGWRQSPPVLPVSINYHRWNPTPAKAFSLCTTREVFYSLSIVPSEASLLSNALRDGVIVRSLLQLGPALGKTRDLLSRCMVNAEPYLPSDEDTLGRFWWSWLIIANSSLSMRTRTSPRCTNALLRESRGVDVASEFGSRKYARPLRSLRGAPIQKRVWCGACVVEGGKEKRRGVQCSWLREVDERNLRKCRRMPEEGA